MRVCIVGYGRMGRNHERVLKQLGHEVVLIVDPNGGTVDELPISHGSDVAVIAAPIDDLAGLAAVANSYGLDVLVEKPGATYCTELRHVQLWAKQQGRKLIVGYTERHNPAVAALKQNLHRVGDIKHISARRLGYAFDRAGDPALDLATHDLDVIDYLFGGELQLDHVARSQHHLSALLHHGETTVSIEASHLHREKVRELEVVGVNGVLHLDYQEQTLELDGTTPIQVDKAEPLVREWEAFFRGEGSDGIAAMTIAEQMVEAESPVRLAA